MKGKRFLVDLLTGETLEVTASSTATENRQTAKGFYMGFADREYELLKDKTITPTAIRILWALKCKMDYTNHADITQTELSKDLHIDRSDVSRAIKILANKGIIERIKRSGRFYTYRINNSFARKGRNLKAVK